MSVEIVTRGDGTLWVIDGDPGHYRARPVGPPVGDDPKKYQLRRRILDGEFSDGGEKA